MRVHPRVCVFERTGLDRIELDAHKVFRCDSPQRLLDECSWLCYNYQALPGTWIRRRFSTCTRHCQGTHLWLMRTSASWSSTSSAPATATSTPNVQQERVCCVAPPGSARGHGTVLSERSQRSSSCTRHCQCSLSVETVTLTIDNVS